MIFEKRMKLITAAFVYSFATAKTCLCQNLVDKHATKETKALYKNLHELSF